MARQAAVVTLFVVQWWVLVQVARPMNLLRGLIVGGSIVGFLVVLYVPWISHLFDLSWEPDRAGLVALGFGVLGAAAVSVAHALSGHGKVEEDLPASAEAPDDAG